MHVSPKYKTNSNTISNRDIATIITLGYAYADNTKNAK